MCEILVREDLAPVTKLFEIAAPEIARKTKAGQFVIIRTCETGERIPLTIADFDRAKGTITLISRRSASPPGSSVHCRQVISCAA